MRANSEDQDDDLLPLNIRGTPILAKKEGYLQAIDGETLMSLSMTHDLYMQLGVKPGDFIELDQPIVEVWGNGRDIFRTGSLNNGEQELPSELSQRINETLIVGRRRTPRQDPECALEELVEVAVRALSPGINDPFTAIACIDRLSAGLGRLAQRAMPPALRADEENVPRVLVRRTRFPNLVDAAFNPLRQHGVQCVAVAIRLVEALTRIASHTSTNEQRESVRRHAEMLRHEFRALNEQPGDGNDFEQCYERMVETLDSLPDKSRERQSPYLNATS